MSMRLIAAWRRPLGLWLPLLGVVALLSVGCAAFGELTVTFESDEDPDPEYYHPFWFHGQGVEETTRIEGMHFDENGTTLFDAEPVVWTDYDEISDRGYLDLDAMEILAKDVDGANGRGAFLAMLVIVGLVAHLRKPFDDEGSTTAAWAFTGFLVIAGLSALLGAYTIVSDFGAAVESAAESDETGFSFQPTIAGSADEMDDGTERVVTWAPGGALWLMLLACLLLLGGAALHAPTVVRRIDAAAEGDQHAVLPSFATMPERLRPHAPMLGTGALGLLLLGALVLPWFTMEQHVHAAEPEDDTASEHVFAWSITQWQVWTTSDSLFEVEDPDDTTSEWSMESHGDHPRLATVISDVSGMRWATLSSLLVVALAGALSLSQRFRQSVGGNSEGWRALLLVGIVLTMGLGTSGFDEAVGESAVIDAHRASPDGSVRYQWGLYAGPDLVRGSMLGTIQIDANTSSFVEAVWEPGPATHAATLMSMLAFVMLLDLVVVAARRPGTADALREGRHADLLDATAWVAPMTVASVIGLLIVSMLGSGIGSLLLHPSMGAPEELERWSVSSDGDSWNDATDTEVLSDGETLELTVQPNAEARLHVRMIMLQIECDEGSQGLITDQSDTFDVEIVPPEGIDFEGVEPRTFTLDASQDCSWWGSSRYMENNAPDPNDGQYWAASADEAVNQSGFDWTGGSEWTFRITANVNGGSTPADQDSNAQARLSVQVNTWNVTVSR